MALKLAPKDRIAAAAVSIVQGAVGDRLHAAGSPLAGAMALTLPERRGPRACVFVHGLMATPQMWFGRDVAYPVALQEQLGIDPILAAYNSGRPVRDNGRELAEALEAQRWEGLQDLLLCGHSMGGLVARCALAHGAAAGHGWVEQVDRVILLGTPLAGAPLEQVAQLASATLRAIWNPWTKLIGHAIALRSDGIKDLRRGADGSATPLPARVRWFLASGALGPGRDTLLARMLGDGLVPQGSATAGARAGVDPAVVEVFPETTHAGLMASPAVQEQLLDWCSRCDYVQMSS